MSSLHAPPRTPTLLRDRLPALHAYVEAEQLCDAGSAAAGIKKFQLAYKLAWELELEAWPGWARALHRQLLAGAEPSGPPDPPCVNRGTGWLFPALCAERSAGPVGEWWRRASALDAVGAALARNRHGVTPRGSCQAGHAEAAAMLDSFTQAREAALRLSLLRDDSSSDGGGGDRAQSKRKGKSAGRKARR